MSDWLLKLRDGTEIKIAADKVGFVQHKMTVKEPIATKNRVILYSEIEKFEEWSQPKTVGQTLEESAAAAFGSPIYTDDHSVKAKWVKRLVDNSKYNSFYAQSPGYRKLSESADGVVIGYRLPVHQIKAGMDVVICNADEAKALERSYDGRT